VRARVGEILSSLRSEVRDVKWVVPENLHLTLKFLGTTPSARLGEVRSVLEEASLAGPPFALELRGLGAFPTPRRARVVWLGVGGELERLTVLARAVDRGLHELGVPREARDFAAHLTLGRRREPRPDEALERALREGRTRSVGAFRVTEMVLMKSELRPTGPTYTVMGRFPLKG
ncbi:MAG: RNA 2',3'-cyclic phosphodiesterase, partial [Candidatus Eremiobacterota bacterium]